MSAIGNALVKHGVPPCEDAVGASGSIVSRCITTRIPWEKLHAQAQAVIENRKEKKRLKK